MEKKKMKVTPEQIEKACEQAGKTANAVDNLYGNVKEQLGPFGKSLGFGVIVTFILAMIHSPALLWVLVAAVAFGSAPMIHKKAMELKAAAEKRKAEKAEAEKAEAAKEPSEKK